MVSEKLEEFNNIMSEIEKQKGITIKLESIQINNVKCVREGKIQVRPEGKSIYDNDIIGIYGQNGSGKSTVVDVLKTLKSIMSGDEDSIAKNEIATEFNSMMNGKMNKDYFFTNNIGDGNIDEAKIQVSFIIYCQEEHETLRAEYQLLFKKEHCWFLNEEKFYLSKFNVENGKWNKKVKLLHLKKTGNPEKLLQDSTISSISKEELRSLCERAYRSFDSEAKYSSKKDLTKKEQNEISSFVKNYLKEAKLNLSIAHSKSTKEIIKKEEEKVAGYTAYSSILKNCPKLAILLISSKEIDFNEEIAHGITVVDEILCFDLIPNFVRNISIFTNMGITDEVLTDIAREDFNRRNTILSKSSNRQKIYNVNPLIPHLRLNDDKFKIDFSKFCSIYNKIIKNFVPNIEIEFNVDDSIYFDLEEILPESRLKENIKDNRIDLILLIKTIILSYFKKENPLKLLRGEKYTLSIYNGLATDIVIKINKLLQEHDNDIDALYASKPVFNVSLAVAYNKVTGVPLSLVSNGTKKIICWLSSLIDFYNDPSKLCVIDEFDAGIFEYLLGELLSLLQDRGQGQLIFTSHNLRPLEVLKPKSIYFTTNNPNNKYFQLKNIKPTHNLRDCYFKSIILGGQSESLYQDTDLEGLGIAFYEAGGGDDK